MYVLTTSGHSRNSFIVRLYVEKEYNHSIMNKKASGYCYKLIVKDYRILKILFTILASLLIYDTFYSMLVLKPTYTSNEKRKMTAEDFPEVMVCPEQAFDKEALLLYDYSTPTAYIRGRKNIHKHSTYVSWGGNTTEDIKAKAKAISTIKSIQKCPNILWKFKNQTSRETVKNTTIELTRALDPYHMCCKYIPPKLSKFYPVIDFRLEASKTNITSFKVFMADQLTASYFDLHKKIMIGDKIVTVNDGWTEYKVQIIENNMIEGDPKYECIDYKTKGKYAKCIENEIIRENSKFLNCTPPWMTENETLWCIGKNKLNNNSRKPYFNFIADIIKSKANEEKCLVPCKVKKFEAREISKSAYIKVSQLGLRVVFENDVDVIKSSWQMDEITLLSKIGGFIGISKNFLWLIILLISSTSALISYLNVQRFNKQ